MPATSTPRIHAPGLHRDETGAPVLIPEAVEHYQPAGSGSYRYPEPDRGQSLPMIGVVLTALIALLLLALASAAAWIVISADWPAILDQIAPTTRMTLEDGVRLIESRG
ncbi:hypothetical protein [Paracoccus alkenifer]|uniref:Uncharacterized protein n=1 Tax=Paracoccus alkenifer TaxID=65735 RepID=A0A1H6NHB9_9RHOB|nr:hypothetical protein [Paracoccus alkenifer]SEI09948.1 hypothetical protein SAMN04488075_2846 [Paracoccus alkenifer]